KAHPNLPSELLGGRSTIALRHSNAPITQDLLSQLKSPITSTSANRSGNPPAESAFMAAKELGPNLDLILDGGRAADKKPSTVVDVSGNDISILREGTIRAELVWKIVDKDL
ncbi:MAG: Sua5/YciO/YrdC/YwlC family protein, partial [bacterium]|nr:Sua5/YciO/YrdC/YwlC family protein [bacterium]